MKIFKRIMAALCCVVIMITGIGYGTVAADEASYFTEVFDSRSGMYTETFGNGRQFITTVPNGGMTYDGVILNIPKDIKSVLTCDGKIVSFNNGEPIYGKGYYTLSVSARDVISGEGVSGLYTFRIMGMPAKGAYSSLYGCPMAECINTIENDSATGMYKYTFPNYKGFFATVPGYNAEVESAAFIFPVNLGYSLKRNGIGISVRNNQQITAPGNYVLTVYSKNYGVADGYELVYETKLNFSIPDRSVSYESADIQVKRESSVPAASSSVNTAGSTAVSEPVTSAGSNITEDSLTETYNEGANLYKETFSNGDAFYTNISNNGISGGNVYIDIPSNMSVTMTKDGLSAAFENRTYINEQGTYVLSVISNFGNSKYRARFTFRIQNGIEASDTNIRTSDESMGAGEREIEIPETVSGDMKYSDIDNVFNTERNMFEYTVGGEKFYANMPSGMFANGKLILDVPESLICTATRSGEDYEFTDEITESGDYEIYVNDIEGNSITLTFSLYDRAVNSIDGFAAPKGYSITNIVYDDYKNTYASADSQTEEENDTKESKEADETDANDEENEKVGSDAGESSEGGNDEENIAEIWQAGTDLITAQADKAAATGVSSVVMPIDGRYTIELKGNGLPSLSTEIMIDKTAPVVTFEGLDERMKSVGNEVTVNCAEEGVTMTLFSKSGEENLLSENGGSVTFRGVGQYTLTAVDEAGNQSDYEFRIVRHIGAAGVGAIVLFIVIVAGVIVFIVYNSKKFSVR